MTAGQGSKQRDRYASVAIALHWLIALAIMLQVSLAWRMDGPLTPENFALIQLHKSVGITVLALSVLRLGWRLANPPPPLPADMPPWEKALAHAAHLGLYAIMIGMPLTGWLMVSASKRAIPTLLYGAVHWPDLPGFAAMAPGAKAVWRAIGENGHGLLADGLYLLFVLHVAGALKHQFLDRDQPILARMAPGAAAGRWWEPRLMIIAAVLVAAAAFGKTVQPHRPAQSPPAAIVTSTPSPAASPVAEPPVAIAAPTPGQSAEPVAWKVDAGSTLGFTTSWSGDAVQGRFERWTAAIVFSPDALDRSKVSVSIDIASAKTGDEQRDASLPASDWFDIATHPKATFTASKFERTGADRYVAHGTLSLRGVSKPLDLPFKLSITGDKAKVSAETSLDRTLFGVGQGEFAATDQIPAKVTVRVELTATRHKG